MSASGPPAASSRTRLPGALLGLYSIVWLLAGFSPYDRPAWLLENLLVMAVLPVVVVSHRQRHFSLLACWGMFVFFVLHAIGSHYTYSKVPYEAWLRALTGRTLSDMLGWNRNHYDRLVHFGYGLLLTPTFTELLERIVVVRKRRLAWLFPLSFAMASSLVYELFEWASAVMFGGGLGVAFLGIQGDEWDAQKDMLLASAGSAFMLLCLAVTGRLEED